MAEYLCIATALGLSRRDALLMEISTVYEMADIRAANRKKGGEKPWP